MIEPIFRIVIVSLGVAIVLLSAWGMVVPEKLMGWVQGVMDRPQGMVIAVGARIVMGLALIGAASVSKFPQGFLILGVTALAAALAFPFVGRKRLRALLGWFDQLGPAFMRTWLILGLVFGACLIYGIV